MTGVFEYSTMTYPHHHSCLFLRRRACASTFTVPHADGRVDPAPQEVRLALRKVNPLCRPPCNAFIMILDRSGW